MNKRLALFLSASSVVSLSIVGIVACSSDNTPSSFPPGEPDAAQFDQGVGFNQDGNTTGQDVVGPVVCNPSLPATFVASWTPPTKSAACSTDDINGYFTACITSLSNPDAGTTCATWKAANTDCGSCIETTDNNGPIQFYQNREYFTVNVAGCLSIERGETADGTCPATYSKSFQCQRASCDDCFKDPNAKFSNFTSCEGAAKANTSTCGKYEAAKSAACGSSTTTADGGLDCFPTKNEAEDAYYKRSIVTFCGK